MGFIDAGWRHQIEKELPGRCSKFYSKELTKSLNCNLTVQWEQHKNVNYPTSPSSRSHKDSASRNESIVPSHIIEIGWRSPEEKILITAVHNLDNYLMDF